MANCKRTMSSPSSCAVDAAVAKCRDAVATVGDVSGAASAAGAVVEQIVATKTAHAPTRGRNGLARILKMVLLTSADAPGWPVWGVLQRSPCLRCEPCTATTLPSKAREHLFGAVCHNVGCAVGGGQERRSCAVRELDSWRLAH